MLVLGSLFPAQQQPLPAPEPQSKSGEKEPWHGQSLKGLLQTPSGLEKMLGRSREYKVLYL